MVTTPVLVVSRNAREEAHRRAEEGANASNSNKISQQRVVFFSNTTAVNEPNENAEPIGLSLWLSKLAFSAADRATLLSTLKNRLFDHLFQHERFTEEFDLLKKGALDNYHDDVVVLFRVLSDGSAFFLKRVDDYADLLTPCESPPAHTNCDALTQVKNTAPAASACPSVVIVGRRGTSVVEVAAEKVLPRVIRLALMDEGSVNRLGRTSLQQRLMMLPTHRDESVTVSGPDVAPRHREKQGAHTMESPMNWGKSAIHQMREPQNSPKVAQGETKMHFERRNNSSHSPNAHQQRGSTSPRSIHGDISPPPVQSIQREEGDASVIVISSPAPRLQTSSLLSTNATAYRGGDGSSARAASFSTTPVRGSSRFSMAIHVPSF